MSVKLEQFVKRTYRETCLKKCTHSGRRKIVKMKATRKNKFDQE